MIEPPKLDSITEIDTLWIIDTLEPTSRPHSAHCSQRSTS